MHIIVKYLKTYLQNIQSGSDYWILHSLHLLPCIWYKFIFTNMFISSLYGNGLFSKSARFHNAFIFITWHLALVDPSRTKWCTIEFDLFFQCRVRHNWLGLICYPHILMLGVHMVSPPFLFFNVSPLHILSIISL